MEARQQSKKIPTNILRSIAILTVVFLGYNGIKVAKLSRSLDRQIEEIRKEVATENKRLEELKIEYENIDSLQTVETIAREKLGYVKEDEIVFREKY